MSRWKQRLARRRHLIAWKLDPLPMSLYGNVDAPMTKAGAEVIADIVSGELGRRVGLLYSDVGGSPQRVD
jgi:hypothetical protein